MGYDPKLVCFSCKFGWGYLMDLNALREEAAFLTPVECSGRLDALHLLKAFKEGADGILILACEEGHCHFQEGNFRTLKMLYLLRDVLQAHGIEKERVRIEFSLDPEGRKIRERIARMKESLSALGPVNRTLL
ncbi:MAG: hydrogenase iron-sulfur subunit [Deltaproteobacteria bacterium]|nr:hydrogenase iron-sulfur subunit [Deltaproteobacteria bacterium]